MRLVLLALLLTSCASKSYQVKTNPDFYMNVYPRFVFWSMEETVRVDVFIEPSQENCHMGIAWQGSKSTWDIGETSSRLQSRTIRLRDLTPGDHKIIAVVWKCDGSQERREFNFKVMEGVP